MIKYIKKYKNIITIVIILILIIGSIIIRLKLKDSNKEISKEDDLELLENIEEQEEIAEEVEEDKTIFVDIKGAINNPGVYEIEATKRIIDVVNKAGGLREDANTSFVNLAKQVEDAMVIIIYTEDEISKAKADNEVEYIIDNTCICPSITNDACLDSNINSSNSQNTESSNTNILTNKININTASLIELQELPGIGASKAQAIIDYRDTNGSFNTIEEIKNVSGIGDSAFEKIKDYITV